MERGVLTSGRIRRGLPLAVTIAVILAMLLTAASPASATQFSSSTAIKMPNGEDFLPYPSVIPVSGQRGEVTGVRVALRQIAHTDVDEISALLVAPSGASTLVLYRRCNGQNTEAAPLTWTFDDAAPLGLSLAGPCASATYQPSADFDPSFDYPAPPPPHGRTLSGLTGGSPNGLWQLFLDDSVGAVDGEVSGGWTLDLSLSKAKKCKKP
ncbi:MAG: hypothetical protein ACXWFN_03555, partial [Solirubrobacterales bacterium]